MTAWKNACNEIESGKITPQQGLLKILDSFAGCKDQNSTKYRLIQKLFDVHANDDKEAEKMMEMNDET